MLLTFKDVEPGIQECRLNLSLLYPDRSDRDQFERKWVEFFTSDHTHAAIFKREGDDILIFYTESLIPTKLDDRPSILFLLGNPASHSVFSGMCFSYEGDNREHRFWIALRKTGFLEFHSDSFASQLSWDERNRLKKQEFYELKYRSPFRVGIAVYFSVPSTASTAPWTGVSGIQRLFGQRALCAIAVEEQRRIEGIIRNFIKVEGSVIAFQRDAYEGVRAPDAPAYSLDLALRGELYGSCKYNTKIRLIGAPPTRYLHSGKARNVLTQFKKKLTGD